MSILERIIGNPQVGTKNEKTRIAWVEDALKNIPAGSRILDAGAGEQIFRPFCSHLKYVAQDFGKYDGKGNQAGLQTGKWDQSKLDIVCDIVSIPEPDGSFDAVLCTEVLEHLPDPVAAIREFGRLLRSGGHLIVTAPFCSLTHFAPFHFSTGFNRYFYETHLRDSGFEILEMTANGNFFEFIGQELRRIPEVADRFSEDRVRRVENASLRVVFKMLERLSSKDNGSSSLLHFGFQVKAIKRT